MARPGCDLSVTDVIEALTVLLSPGLSNQKEAEGGTIDRVFASFILYLR